MSVCLLNCRQEFQRKHFGFGDVHPGRFSLFQWRSPPWLYLVYRVVLAIYVDFWLIYTAERQIGYTGESVLYSWPVYLTNWTYFMLAVYLSFHAIGTLIFVCKGPMPLKQSPSPEDHHNMFVEFQTFPSLWGGNEYDLIPDEGDHVVVRMHQLPWYFKVTWILYNIISSAAVMVTAVFFIFLWPGGGIDMDNLQLHGLNSVIIIIEHLVSAVPIRLYHYIYPLIYGLVYMFFSVIFWAVDHSHVIYPNVLDWNEAGTTTLMILILGFIILPFFQLCFFAIYKIKLCIYKRINNHTTESVSNERPNF